MPTEMVARTTYWPKEWMDAIDKARGETPFAEFVRECVREKIGKRKLSATRKRGRPKDRQ